MSTVEAASSEAVLTRMRASDLLVQALENEGVEYVFGVPGEENLDFLDSLRTSNIELILTRHEQAAGFMAATYGRLPASLAFRPVPAFPDIRRVGLRVARFEACSTFTRVAAHMVAKPPKAARCTGVLQSKSLPPSTAPIATGWSDSCRAGFAPAG